MTPAIVPAAVYCIPIAVAVATYSTSGVMIVLDRVCA
jgi:hypothetical protein